MSDGLEDDPPADGPPDSTGQAPAIQRLAAMNVPERVVAAMRGTREMRALLIRDSNKTVALTVLRSPQLTEPEVEQFARMSTVDADVLRAISQSRAWLKNYAIAHALVKNPKTPLGVSLPLLRRLHDADLRRLSEDRNIPEALRIAARKKVVLERR